MHAPKELALTEREYPMNRAIDRRDAPALLVVAAAIVFQLTLALADSPNYVPSVGLEKATAAVARLEQIGNGPGQEAAKTLLVEGKALLALEEQYRAGILPLSIEARQADEKTLALNREGEDLKRRIEAFNANPGTQEEADALERQRQDYNARLEAHRSYFERDLQVRLAADNKQLEERYNAFLRNTDRFFALVVDASAVREAVAKGRKPPFASLWSVHEQSRDIARGLAPDENRCALRLSITLGLVPREGEATLDYLGSRQAAQITRDLSGAGLPAGSDLGKRYYIKSEQLAQRLRELWKAPAYAQGQEAVEKLLLNKKGVVFFDGGFGWPRSLNHIDLWDGHKWSSYDPTQSHTDFSTAAKRARSVWFWEIRN